MPTDLHGLSLPARSFLVALLIAFDAFALCRAVPVNSHLPVNNQHQYGDHDRRLYRIWNMAEDRAERPFWEVKDHLLFHGRNGAIYIFVAETFIRLGVDEPLPIQVFSIVLFDVGLLLFFLWTRAVTSSELFAGAASLFLLSTPFLLYHSVSLHEDAYTFVFLNLTLYLFVRYLFSRRVGWLVGAAVSYFLLCHNYWMYYVSTFLLLLGLQQRARRFRPIATVVLGLVPVLAAGTIFLEMSVVHGGIGPAWRHLRSTGEERVGMTSGGGLTSHFSPDELIATRSMGDDQALMREYPLVVADRVGRTMGLPLWAFGLMLVGALLVDLRGAFRLHGWLIWVIAAGLSWPVLMVQHTAVHEFAGNYTWFAWTLILATAARALHGALREDRRAVVFGGVAAACAAALLSPHYMANLRLYVANIRELP